MPKRRSPLGQRDLEQKAAFVTEDVQRYGESSANGGRIKNYNRKEEKRSFSTLIIQEKKKEDKLVN